jgi:hypothetical protein
LNSGDTKGWDEAVLMQGVVHDRVQTIRETFQNAIWSRYAKVGLDITMVIVEPEFDDQTPAFDRAEKSQVISMTRNERRDLVGLDPLPDYDSTGAALGLAIELPGSLNVVGEGPDENGNLAKREASTGDPLREKVDAAGALIRAGFVPADALKQVGLDPIRHVGLLPITLQAPEGSSPAPAFAKAGPLKGLRGTLETRWVSRLTSSLRTVLKEQMEAVAARVRAASPAALERHKNDPDYWWNDKKETARMTAVLQGPESAIASEVLTRVTKVLPKPEGKAMPDDVTRYVLKRTGDRITDINATTRQAIVSAILAGFDQGESPSQVADRIETIGAFAESRAELIARTETMNAYNAAALQSYREYGVERVTAIDGDQDEECAARDGQEYSLEEALDIEDHPNGTLDWAPAIKAKPDTLSLILEQLAKAREPVNVTVINGDPKQYREVVDYGFDGSILGSHMEPMDG